MMPPMAPPVYGSDSARALHAEAPALDLHADPLIWSRYLGYDLNKRHSPPFPRAQFGGHIDVPRLLEGGVGGVFFGLVSIPALDWNRGGTCSTQLELLEDAIAKSEGRLRLATTESDLDRARDEHAVAAFVGMEGAHSIEGKLENLEGFAKRGLRYLGLLHFSANDCGAPAFGWGANADRGLSAFGHDVVKKAEDLGVIVDLAHINRKGFMDVCAIAEKPMYVSHTGVAGAHDMWRNIDDEQLRTLANKGGAAGIIFAPQYLGRDGIDAVVEHLEHILNVAGEDTPALGSDWDGFIRPTKGLEEASKLPSLTDALLARGHSPRVIKKILRENAARVLREAPPRAFVAK
jgi:membrane dipeptidase